MFEQTISVKLEPRFHSILRYLPLDCHELAVSFVASAAFAIFWKAERNCEAFCGEDQLMFHVKR